MEQHTSRGAAAAARRVVAAAPRRGRAELAKFGLPSARALRYDKPDPKKGEKPSWKDLGKGQLRVMRHKTTNAARVVVRNDVGKVVLNFALAAAMTCRKTKAGVAVTAATAEGAQQYLLRTKEPLEASHLAPAKLVV